MCGIRQNAYDWGFRKMVQKSFDFWQKYPFLVVSKISNFEQKLLVQIPFFDKFLFLDKIFIFGQNFDFWTKF